MKKISIVFGALILWSALFLTANAAQHPVGTNIVGTDGTIFTITTQNGQTVKRPYTSAGAYLSYSFNSWINTAPASPDDLALPTGSPIPPQDGKVFCSDRGADKGTCYLISNGQKAGFISADIFHGLGYSFDNALYGDVSFLNPASNISAVTEAHQPGTLVNKDGTVYLVGDNGLVGVPNSDTLESWGYSFKDVVPANPADNLLTAGGVLPVRKPDQLEIFSYPTPPVAVPTTTPPIIPVPIATSTVPTASSTAAFSVAAPPVTTLSGSGGVGNGFAGSVPQGAHAVGTNVVDATGSIYMISPDGTRRPYPSDGIFLSYGFNAHNQTVPINSADLTMPIGAPIPPSDGKVVCPTAALDNGTCFLITGGRTAAFTAPGLIAGLGFSLSNAVIADVRWMDATAPITDATSAHRPGVLINNNGAVQYVGSNGLWGIPNIATMNSWGFSFSNAVLANAADRAMAQTGVLPFRILGQLNPLQAGVPTAPSSGGGGASSPPVTSSTPVTLQITPTVLPNATIGQAYTTQIQVTGGTAPYSWSTLSTTYPSGCCVLGLAGNSAPISSPFVTFNTQSSNVVISTNPAGTYSWNIQVTDSAGHTVTQMVSLTINPAPGNPPVNSGGSGSGGSAPTPAPTPSPTPTPTQTARVGQLVNNNGIVEYVGNGGIYGIPSLDVFHSWWPDFSGVVPANSAEIALTQIGVIPTKLPGCSTPLQQLAGTCGTNATSTPSGGN